MRAGPGASYDLEVTKLHWIRLLGPALVAAVAYVDPGNVAANMTAGTQYGFLLLWVLVLANAMAAVVQYLAAKLGLVTGRSLPEHLASRLGTPGRILYWLQAEAVIIATDVAEVIGGALALHILWGVPLWLGGILTGAVSVLLLRIRDRRGQRRFEKAVVALLAVVAAGFLFGVFLAPPTPGQLAGGLVPRFADQGSVFVAVSMLGATVMPHAIYLHSGLAVHRHGAGAAGDPFPVRTRLRAARFDVGVALAVAGLVNIGMLVLAATALQGAEGTDTIEGAHAAIAGRFGAVAGVVFAVGLLASGLASTTVGAYAGDVVMGGLLGRTVPAWVRRAVSLVPAIGVMVSGADPTAALVVSQVVLSMAIPFAVFPLAWLTSRASVMGRLRSGRALAGTAWACSGAVAVLNAVLLWLVFTGAA